MCSYLLFQTQFGIIFQEYIQDSWLDIYGILTQCLQHPAVIYGVIGGSQICIH